MKCFNLSPMARQLGFIKPGVMLSKLFGRQAGQVGGVPTRQDLQRYSVNRPGWEAVRQTLYDYQAYAQAGQSQLLFFQVPRGQSSKTSSDTNMDLAGNLSANTEFLVESIEVQFWPTVPAVAAANPAATGATAAAVLVNDAYIVGRTGNLVLTIGQKQYLTEAPLGKFPGKTHFFVSGAHSDSSTAGGTGATRTVFGYWTGRPYLLSPVKLYLISTQNFSVSLNWPEGVQAVSNPGRIGVVLDGILYRKSQ